MAAQGKGELQDRVDRILKLYYTQKGDSPQEPDVEESSEARLFDLACLVTRSEAMHLKRLQKNTIEKDSAIAPGHVLIPHPDTAAMAQTLHDIVHTH